MRCQKLNDFFAIISNYYLFTLYDKEKNETRIAIFFNRELRDKLGISIELSEELDRINTDIVLNRFDNKDNIINKITESFGKPVFDTSLYDLYCTENLNLFEAKWLILNFNLKESDQLLSKEKIPYHPKNDGFSNNVEFWLYIVWMYHFNKDIKKMLVNDIKSFYSDNIDQERKELKTEIILLKDQIKNEMKKILKFSEYYINYTKNNIMTDADFFKEIPDNETFIDNFNDKYNPIKEKIDRILQEESVKKLNNEEKDIIKHDGEMEGVFGISLQNFIAGVCVLGGILVVLYCRNFFNLFIN